MAEEGDLHQVELDAALGIESRAGREALAHPWAPAAQTAFLLGDHERLLQVVVHRHGRAKTTLDLERPLGQMDQELLTPTMEAEPPMDPARARLLGKLVLGRQRREMRLVLVPALRRMLVVVTAGILVQRHLPGEPLPRHRAPAATTRGATRPRPQIHLHTMPRLQEAPCRPLPLAL